MEQEFDKIITDMRIDQSLGGILIAQAFVDYCQALINAQIAETDGSELFGLLENATLAGIIISGAPFTIPSLFCLVAW